MPSWNDIVKQHFEDLMQFVRGAGTVVMDGAKGVKNFAVEQVPLYLQEMIKYEIWSNLLWVLFFVSFCVFFIYGANYYHKKAINFEQDNKHSHNDDSIFGCLIAKYILIVLVIIFTIPTFRYAESAIKATIAPRLIIVEKIQEIIKDSTERVSCGNGR